MAAFNKFNVLSEHIAHGVHNWNTHTLKVALSNTAPSASANFTLSDITQITAGNGYTAGGNAVTVTSSGQTGGTYKLVGNDVEFTADGGSIGPFRYVILYNDTPTSPADPLIGWWDNGSEITLANGEKFTVDFDATEGIFQIKPPA